MIMSESIDLLLTAVTWAKNRMRVCRRYQRDPDLNSLTALLSFAITSKRL